MSLAHLVDIEEILSDGFGNSWPKFAILDNVGLARSTRFCKFLVEREIVRPGKIQEIRRWRLTEQ